MTGLPPIDQSLLPAAVRNGSPAERKAYDTGLGFEQMLLQQLTTELAQTAQLTPDSTESGDSSGDSGDGSGGDLGLSGTDSSYLQMLPDALTSALMANGGLGLAAQLMPQASTDASATDPSAAATPATDPSTGQLP